MPAAHLVPRSQHCMGHVLGLYDTQVWRAALDVMPVIEVDDCYATDLQGIRFSLNIVNNVAS